MYARPVTVASQMSSVNAISSSGPGSNLENPRSAGAKLFYRWSPAVAAPQRFFLGDVNFEHFDEAREFQNLARGAGQPVQGKPAFHIARNLQPFDQRSHARAVDVSHVLQVDNYPRNAFFPQQLEQNLAHLRRVVERNVAAHIHNRGAVRLPRRNFHRNKAPWGCTVFCQRITPDATNFLSKIRRKGRFPRSDLPSLFDDRRQAPTYKRFSGCERLLNADADVARDVKLEAARDRSAASRSLRDT